MTGRAAWDHAQAHRRVHAVMTSAMRADASALEALATGPAGARLDPYTREFVRDSRRLLLAGSAGLTCVLAAHRPGEGPDGTPICRGCGTRDCRTLHGLADVLTAYAVRPVPIDRAEAWRRADACFRAEARPVPLAVDEFDEGFIVRPVRPGGASPLIVDRGTGALTRWPDFRREVLIEHYCRYIGDRL
ncbi:hypothetical protein [Actinomadura sp. CNU-125]|uniref:hypothetical protein n=1 Tax=Actinomadura sp. CNU-125 TaxID=1904961 RepID=UPI00117818D0|nr:hypothetical protein [Actinomadura sp. CNU-125]